MYANARESERERDKKRGSEQVGERDECVYVCSLSMFRVIVRWCWSATSIRRGERALSTVDKR